MAQHISETGQAAFTWTGPYGSGKSSLVLALSALLCGNRKLQKYASFAIGNETAKQIKSSLKPKDKGFHILPVVGRRDSAANVIGKAIETTGLLNREKFKAWTDDRIVSTLTTVTNQDKKNHGGLIVFIDEMGKFLEGAAQDNTDIYLFQLLAEAASRSHGRLIVVCVMHQTFNEYADNLSSEMRDEWSKIQGRFVDLVVNAA